MPAGKCPRCWQFGRDRARIALLNRGARREIEAVVRDIEKIETAIEPSFQDHFVKAMAIPHKSDPYARLAAEVELPERILTAEDAPAIEGAAAVVAAAVPEAVIVADPVR